MRLTRQNILIGVFGLLVAVFGGQWAWEKSVAGPLARRREQAIRLQRQIDQRKAELEQFQRDAEQLAIWESQSLPSDPEIARSLYSDWLRGLAGRLGLLSPTVDAREASRPADSFHLLSVAVQGRGSTAQWVRFLLEFYRAGHLHQIRSMSVTPLDNGRLLECSLGIEALILPSADRDDRLSSVPGDKLAFDNWEDYELIVHRNLFAPSSDSDPTEQTFLTAVNYISGNPEAWFTIRTEDKLMKLRKGESLEIGRFRARIAEIVDPDVILESQGERWLLSIGESLSQALALPPEF